MGVNNRLAFGLLEPDLAGLVRRIVATTMEPGENMLDLKLVVANADNLFQLGIT